MPSPSANGKKLEASQWEPLADALRLEMQEYGELLSLLDEQQKLIFAREAEALLKLNRSVDLQMETAAQLRATREAKASELARSIGASADATVRSILPFLPDVARPLFEALIDETNALIRKTQRRVRQNQMLLARACATMEQILKALRPQAVTKTYTRKGGLSFRASTAGSHMQVSG